MHKANNSNDIHVLHILLRSSTGDTLIIQRNCLFRYIQMCLRCFEISLRYIEI